MVGVLSMLQGRREEGEEWEKGEEWEEGEEGDEFMRY